MWVGPKLPRTAGFLTNVVACYMHLTAQRSVCVQQEQSCNFLKKDFKMRLKTQKFLILPTHYGKLSSTFYCQSWKLKKTKNWWQNCTTCRDEGRLVLQDFYVVPLLLTHRASTLRKCVFLCLLCVCVHLHSFSVQMIDWKLLEKDDKNCFSLLLSLSLSLCYFSVIASTLSASFHSVHRLPLLCRHHAVLYVIW